MFCDAHITVHLMWASQSMGSTKGSLLFVDLEIKMRPILFVEFYLAIISGMEAGVESVGGGWDESRLRVLLGGSDERSSR